MTNVAGRARVLHILGRMERGGAEMRLLEIIRRLSPAEFDVDVGVLSGLPGSLDADVRACGGSVIPLALTPSFPSRFIRLLRDRRYRVVHSHVLHASGPILMLASAAGVPIRIAHFHATHDKHPSTPLRRLQRAGMKHLIDRFATDIISCGQASMDAIWFPAWQSDARCKVVYDAVDPARFQDRPSRSQVRTDLGLPLNAPVFLHVGNEVLAKNHRRLIALFASIRRAEPSAWLLLVGAGTESRDGVSATAIRDFGLGDRVVALGPRDDVPALLGAADELLLPSLFEGLPGVVLEACVSGLPVLASDLPGVREIASRLPGVRYLPLEAPDEEWAEAALALLRKADPIQEVRTAFENSAFHIDRAVDSHRRLWARPA